MSTTLKLVAPSPSKLSIAAFAVAIACLLGITSAPARALPKLDDYAMSTSVTKMTAVGKTVMANQAELSKLGKDFGDSYRVHEGKYTFQAPDYLEYTTQVGPTMISLITTNTTKTVKVRAGIVKQDHTDDISGDTTKRQTLFSLGLLPANYLETVLSTYMGRETVQGTDCVVFDLKYVKEGPAVKRHFLIWVDPVKHYVVQKRVWDLFARQRETVIYTNPINVSGKIWIPTRAELYNQENKLGGVVEYTGIKVE